MVLTFTDASTRLVSRASRMQIGNIDGGETLRRDGHFVLSGFQVEEGIRPRAVGRGSTLDGCAGIDESHIRSFTESAGRILHRSDDGSKGRLPRSR